MIGYDCIVGYHCLMENDVMAVERFDCYCSNNVF